MHKNRTIKMIMLYLGFTSLWGGEGRLDFISGGCDSYDFYPDPTILHCCEKKV